jgi:3-oxoacyl-[acyl-carrier-protein] synthase-3
MRRCRIDTVGASFPGRAFGLFRKGSVGHAVAAGRECLRLTRHRASDIEVLINAGVHRDGHVCEPAGAAYIQHRLGVNVEFQGRPTLSFDLLNGGCGMLDATHVVATQMAAGFVDVGLVVASEANGDRRPDPGYPYPASGAALLLDIASRRDVGFGSFAFVTREEEADLYTSVISLREKRGRIVMRRAAGLEDAWLPMAARAFAEVLEREGIGRERVDLVVPAQVSPGFLARLPEALGMPRDRVADFTADLPDTLSTSTVLALHRVLAGGHPCPGFLVVLLAVGSGLTAAAAIHRF